MRGRCTVESWCGGSASCRQLCSGKATVQKASQEAQTRYETEVKAEDARVAKLDWAQKTNLKTLKAQKRMSWKAKVEAQCGKLEENMKLKRKAKMKTQNAERKSPWSWES